MNMNQTFYTWHPCNMGYCHPADTVYSHPDAHHNKWRSWMKLETWRYDFIFEFGFALLLSTLMNSRVTVVIKMVGDRIELQCRMQVRSICHWESLWWSHFWLDLSSELHPISHMTPDRRTIPPSQPLHSESPSFRTIYWRRSYTFLQLHNKLEWFGWTLHAFTLAVRSIRNGRE